MIEFNKTAYQGIYKLYNSPYYLIGDNISIINELIDSNNIVVIDGITDINTIIDKLQLFETKWNDFKLSLQQFSGAAFDENSRASRINSFKNKNKSQFTDVSKHIAEIQSINKMILDKRKYKINDSDLAIKLFSLANKFEAVKKTQKYYFSIQVCHDTNWYDSFKNQLKLIYAMLNQEELQLLVRTGTIPYFVSITDGQIYKLRTLYNFCEFYGHCVPTKQIEPHLFTSQYMEILGYVNSDDFKSVMAICFMYLYIHNGLPNRNFVLDSSKYLDFELIVKNDSGIIVNMNNPSYYDFLYSISVMFPYIINDINSIINKWHPGGEDMWMGNRFISRNMGSLTEVLTNVQFTYQAKSISDGNYEFFTYLSLFKKYHDSNGLYYNDGNKVSTPENVLLKFDSPNFKLLNGNSKFLANIKLNKYYNGLTKDDNFVKILNSDVFIDNIDIMNIFAYLDGSYIANDKYSMALTEAVTGKNIGLFESDKYFIKLLDDAVADREFFIELDPNYYGTVGGGTGGTGGGTGGGGSINNSLVVSNITSRNDTYILLLQGNNDFDVKVFYTKLNRATNEVTTEIVVDPFEVKKDVVKDIIFGIPDYYINRDDYIYKIYVYNGNYKLYEYGIN
jgi:hypothetical protein